MSDNLSNAALADRLRDLPPLTRKAIYEDVIARAPGGLGATRYAWREMWARADQLVDWDAQWSIFAWVGGRGSGKTRSACEAFIEAIRTGLATSPLIVAATNGDISGTIVDGLSGFMACCPPDFLPVFTASKEAGGVLTFPNGVKARCFSADAPERIRGANADLAWFDDLAAWPPHHAELAWKNARGAIRVGISRLLISTTKRGMGVLRNLLGGNLKGVELRFAQTKDNKNNLSRNFLVDTMAEFEGTDYGREEFDNEDVEDNKLSPFSGFDFGSPPIRVPFIDREKLVRVIVSVDPSDSAGPRSDECGIGVMGIDQAGHIYALEDLSDVLDGDVWGDRVIDACTRWDADAIVAETQRNKDKVLSQINSCYYKGRLQRDESGVGAPPEIIGVMAKEGKVPRATDMRSLYAKGMLHHVPGLAKLEAQQRAWDAALSAKATRKPRIDDRIDWLVHGATYLAKLGKVHVAPPDMQTIRKQNEALKRPDAARRDELW